MAAFAVQRGFDPQEIAGLGDKLPVALNAQTALGRGDWQTALEGVSQLGPGAGEAGQRLTAGALNLVPPEAHQTLRAAGLGENDLRSVGPFLPQAHAAATALAQGDWKGAAGRAMALETVAPDVAARLGQEVVARLPTQERDALGQHGLSDQALSALGTRLPYASLAASSLDKGDWRKASDALDALGSGQAGAMASRAARPLFQSVLQQIPGEVGQALGDLGLNPKTIRGGLAHAADAAMAIQQGDWKGAASSLGLVEDRRAHAAISSAVNRLVPPPVKEALQHAGLDSASIGQLGAALPRAAETVTALEKGDWRTAAAGLQGLPQQIGEKLQRAVLGAIPSDVREAFDKVGFNKADLKELGGALPLALDAAKAVTKGDWKTAAEALGGFGDRAPNATRKLGQMVNELLPADVKTAMGKLGLDQTGLRELRAALPDAVGTAQALAKGDWQGAFRGLEAIRRDAPHLVEKAARAVSDVIPRDVKDALGKAGINAQDFQELGAALPVAAQAAQAVAKGDWKGASQNIALLGQVAPNVSDRIHRELDKVLPPEVKKAVESLGTTARELGAALPHAVDTVDALKKGDWQAAARNIDAVKRAAPQTVAFLDRELGKVLPPEVKKAAESLGTTAQEMGAALPHAVGAAEAVQKGDWRTAAKELDAIKQAAPRTVAALTDRLDKILPEDVKGKLRQLGTTAQEVGAALPHAVDAVDALQKGDWQAAAKNIDAVKRAAPQTVAFLERELDKIVPPEVKDKLGTIGTTVREVGAALPVVTSALDALKKGDWKEAAKSFDSIGELAPHTTKALTDAWDKHVPQGVKDALEPLGVAAENAWMLGSKLGDAVEFADKLKAGDGVGAFDSLQKVVGDPELGKKLEAQLGLGEGQLNAALKKGLIDLKGLQLSGFKGKGTLPDGLVQNDLKLDGATIAEGGFRAGGSLLSASGKLGKEGDLLTAEGSIKLGQAEVFGSGSVKADLKNLSFGATGRIGAKLNLIEAQGKAKLDYGIGSTEVGGHINAGATAQAEGTIKVDPKKLSLAAEIDGEAFVGVQAGATAKSKLGPVAVEGKAGVAAGVGAHFGVDVGLQNGKFAFKLDVGAALGIGFDLSFGFSVDVKKIIEGAGKLLEAPAKLVGDAIKKAGEGVAWLGDKVVDGLKKVGETIVDGAKKVGETIVGGAKKVFKALTKW